MANWYVPRFSRAKQMGLRKHIGLQSIPYVGFLSVLIIAIWFLSAFFGIYYVAGLPSFFIAYTRAVIWMIAESHRIAEFLGERQYYHWANTFRDIEESKTSAPGVSDSRLLSYQYRPWWLAAVLIAGSSAVLVVAIRVRVMVWAAPSAASLLA